MKHDKNKGPGRRICIYADNETLEFIAGLQQEYDCTQSAAFRACVKIVKESVKNGKEKDRESRTGSGIV